MNLFSYRLLLTLFKPFIAYSGWKRCRKYQDSDFPIPHCFASRFGQNPTEFRKGGIWVHAVSVGETRSIFPLLNQLHQDFPSLPLTISNGSTQGALQALKFAPVPIQHQMIPYDFSNAVNRFLAQTQPKLVIMVETEIWPNLYQACAEKNIPLILVNARLKEKSFQAYRKWGGSLVAKALQQTQFIASQYPIDTERLIQLGAPKERTQTLGNLKFDIEILPGLVKTAENWRQTHQANTRFIWVAASTHESEEALMLEAHQSLLKNNPKALLILVPRHANRFEEVAKLCQQSALNTQIQSQLAPDSHLKPSTQVYLADSVGELMHWFSVCDVAFIGGSLVPFGGHNILEPAALQKPVISGQWHQNLQALYDTFKQDKAITLVNTPEELAANLSDFAQEPNKQKTAGKAAWDCFNKQTGVLDKLMKKIHQILA